MRIRRIIRLEPGDCVIVCGKRQRRQPWCRSEPDSVTYSVSNTYKRRRRRY